jgi:hypothetical protein
VQNEIGAQRKKEIGAQRKKETLLKKYLTGADPDAILTFVAVRPPPVTPSDLTLTETEAACSPRVAF